MLLVEFDPASNWYAAALTIAAAWIRTGGRVFYPIIARPPDRIRTQLAKLGMNVQELEKSDVLQIWDAYSATLGQKSREKHAFDSLKVADLSIFVSKELMGKGPTPNLLRLIENASALARFNEEKSWTEWMLTRAFPVIAQENSIGIRGIIKGIHSDWVYRQLEGAANGIIEVKVDEAAEEPLSLMRIKNMQNVRFDGKWHKLRLLENFEVTLEK